MSGKTKKSFYPATIAIFALCFVLICFCVFLFNYRDAYDHTAEPGSIIHIPPSFGVKFKFFLITVAALVAAGIGELIIDLVEKRVRILPLFLCAALLPFACYGAYYSLLGKGGAMYSLVEKDGPLYFVIVGDYNKNGYNDKLEKQYREPHSSNDYVDVDDEFIRFISIDVSGTGFLDTHSDLSYDSDERVITVSVEKGLVEFDEIILTVVFQSPMVNEKYAFYRIVDGELLWQPYHAENCSAVNDKAVIRITDDRIYEYLEKSGTDTAELKFTFDKKPE